LVLGSAEELEIAFLFPETLWELIQEEEAILTITSDQLIQNFWFTTAADPIGQKLHTPGKKLHSCSPSAAESRSWLSNPSNRLSEYEQ